MKKKSLVFILVLSVFFSFILSSSTFASQIITADYDIPNEIEADSVEEFYGIWKGLYVSDGIDVCDADSSIGTFVADIFVDATALLGDYETLIFNESEFLNGRYYLTNDDIRLKVSLMSDGSISIKSENSRVIIYLFKQEVEYEEISYRTLARRPEDYYGSYASFSGTVKQVIGSRFGGLYSILLAVDDNDVQIFAAHFLDIPDYNILSGDKVTIFVHLAGETANEAVLDISSSVPFGLIHSIILEEE